MKLKRLLALAVFAWAVPYCTSMAQSVSVAATTGSGGPYTTLKGAFDAINAGTFTGAITITLSGGTTETATAVLNASGTGSANYTRVRIVPATSGGPFTIAGNLNNNGLIQLNGADNVIIDGNVGGARHLIFSNSNGGGGGTNYASCIMYANGATADTLRNCIVRAATTGADGANIIFNSNGATANSGIYIYNNVLHESSQTPIRLMGVVPIAGAASVTQNIVVRKCHFYNWRFTGNNTQAFRITGATAANNWTIDSCHFYAPVTRDYTGSGNNVQQCLLIGTGSRYIIRNNKFGGSGRDASGNITGTFSVTGAEVSNRLMRFHFANINASGDSVFIQDNLFDGIATSQAGLAGQNQLPLNIMQLSGNSTYLVDRNIMQNITYTNNATSATYLEPTATITEIQMVQYAGTAAGSLMRNNKIQNITLNYSGASAAQNSRFTGYRIAQASGGITLSNNLVSNITASNTSVNAFLRAFNLETGGSITASNNIVQQITSNTYNNTIGFRVAGTGTVQLRNSRVNNVSNSSTLAASNLYGIQDLGTGSSVFASDTINNLNLTGTSNTSLLMGIANTGAGTDSINTCQIYNLQVASTYIGQDGAVVGIAARPIGTGNLYVGQNTVYNIAATNTGDLATNASAVTVAPGASTTTVTLNRNRLYAVRNAAAGTTVPNSACGIILRDQGGTITINNNMVALGYGETNSTVFAGIWSNLSGAGIPVVRHNSVSIGGTTPGVTPSFAYIRGDNTVTGVTTSVQLVNNIFQNQRIGALPLHFAIANQITASGWTANPPCGNLLPNYNAYYANSDAEIGFWLMGGTTNFTDWQTQSGADVNSIDIRNITPNTAISFSDATTADLHTPNNELRVNAKGLPVGLNEDYDGYPFRRGPDIGADEVNNVLTYTGGTGLWHDPTTWNGGVGVPSHADSVIIPSPAMVTVASGNPAACYQLIINSGGTLVLDDGAYLEQCWLHDGTSHFGFVQNNGTINSGAATLALAGHWVDNSQYLDNNEGTVQLNLDAPLTPPTCKQTWIQGYNDNTDTSPLTGSAETVFYNLSILNAGKVTVTGPDYITVGDGSSGTGTLNIVNPDGWLRWDGKDLYIDGTADGPGTLYGSPTSNLHLRGVGNVHAGMTIGTLNWRGGAQMANQLSYDRSGGIILGTDESGASITLQVLNTFTATNGQLSIGNNNTLQLHGYATTSGGTITGSDAFNTYLHLLGTTNDNMGTVAMTTSTIGTQTVTGLVMNRGTTDAASANMGSNIRVSNLLTLTSGRIATGSNEVFVTNTSSGAVGGHSAASFVQGYLRRAIAGATSYDYPLGVQGRYNLLNMATTLDLAPTNEVLGTFTATNASTSGWDPNPLVEAGYEFDCVSEGGYWTLSPYQSGVFTQPAAGAYSITAYPTGIDCATPKTRYTLGKRTLAADPWAFAGSSAASTGLSPASRTGYTSFSDFAIIGADEVPLPVSSLHLAVTPHGPDALLSWTTQDEQNTATFALEHSYEGSDFLPIHHRAAAGYTRGTTTYTHRHTTLPTGLHTYRVHLTDLDGQHTLSNVASIMIGADGATFALLAPYYRDGLRVPLFLPTEGRVELRVISLLGQQLYSGSHMLSYGTHTLSLPQLQLAQGAYIIHVTHQGTTLSQRMWVR